MAAYNGGTSPNPSILISPALISDDLGDWDIVPYGKTVAAANGDRVGPEVQVTSVAYPKATLQGDYSPGIDQEFYGHIIVNPRKLDLGLVLTSKLFTIGVWNLTGYDQRLLNWSVTGLDGVTVTNADGYPVRYGPGAYRDHQVTVGTTGAAQVSGSITFNFEGISTGAATAISGSRLIVFGYQPNWREPVVESLEWLTDVLTSYNDTEQRLALRQDPRRAMRYLFTFETQNKVNHFEGVMWGWQQRVFVVPVWTDWQFLSANITIGATVISTATALRDFAVNNLVLLWRDYLTWEIVEIQSLASSQIVLKKATTMAWTTRDRIIPVRLGRLSKNIQISRPTSTLAEATLSFSYEVGEAVDADRLGTSTWPQYASLDVLTLQPNTVDEDTDETYDRDFDTVDFDKGSWFISDHAVGPVISRPYKWLLRTRQEIMNFLAFLEVRKGKAIPFWMPTWSKDLEQVQDMGSADTNILVKNIGYTRYMNLDPSRSTLIFFPADGSTPIIKAITGCVENSNGTETLSLNSSFGAIKKITDFRAISFLTYCRMDQDSFDLNWYTDSIADVSFRVREIPR